MTLPLSLCILSWSDRKRASHSLRELADQIDQSKPGLFQALIRPLPVIGIQQAGTGKWLVPSPAAKAEVDRLMRRALSKIEPG